MRRIALGVVLVSVVVGAGACEDEKPFGEIVLAVQTDVALPDSVDQIRVEVLDSGGLQFGNDYTVGAGALTIPATLGLLQGEDPAAPFLVRLIARKSGSVKMLREVTTTIPSRIATLRMPIRWLCDDSAKETAPGQVTNATCQAGQTCIGGACYDSNVPASELDDYVPSNVFDGCFDVLGCLGTGAPVVPDASCTIARPQGVETDRLNIGLRVDDDGICDDGRRNCFVVLEPDAKPTGPIEGWRSLPGDRIELAPGVCNRLATGRVKEVLVSGACQRKVFGGPVCGPWSGLQAPAPPPPVPDAGGDDAGPPGTITTIVTGDPDVTVNNQCVVAFSGGHLFFCSSASGTARLQALALPPSPGATIVTPVTFESTIWGGPFVTPERLYWWNRVPAQPSQIRFFSIDTKTLVVDTGDPIPSMSFDDSLPQPHAWDATYLYVGALLGDKMYRVPRAGGPAEELPSVPTIGVFGPTVADQDPAGFVYIAGGDKVERLSKTTPGTLLLGTVPDASILAMTLDGDDIYLAAAQNQDYWIYRLPRAGGVPTKLYTGASFVLPPNNMTVDGDFLYWHYTAIPGAKSIVRAPKTGGVADEVVDPFLNDPSPDAKIFGFSISPERIYYAANFKEGDVSRFKIASYTR